MIPPFNEFVLLNEEDKVPTFCYMLYLEEPYISEALALQNALAPIMQGGEKEEPDHFHTTIRYVKMLSGQNPERFVEWLDGLPLPEIEAFTSKFSLFNKGCIVTELESPGMHEWFNKINSWMTTVGDYPPSEYPTYKPHVTLFKGVENETAPKFDPAIHHKKFIYTNHIVTDKNHDVIFERKVRTR